MCSFAAIVHLCELNENLLFESMKFMRRRGPDLSNVGTYGFGNRTKLTLVHHLLDVSGSTAMQPVSNFDKNIHLLFNGELYDVAAGYSSDTDWLAEQVFGKREYIHKLRSSEYVICDVNVRERTISVFTDAFMTKPCFYAFRNNWTELAIASYPSVLTGLGFTEVRHFEANSRTTFLQCADSEQFTIQVVNNYIFDTRSDESDANTWITEFHESVRRRSTHGSLNFFVPLSSGYDSGAICCALNNLMIPYQTITIATNENMDIIKERIAINEAHSCIRSHFLGSISNIESAEIQDQMRTIVEPMRFKHDNAPPSLLNDSGSIGMFKVCKYAKSLNLPVCLSGSGADEIVSDYGFDGEKMFPQSQFGGRFPEDLSTLFPWENFYSGTQRSYILKDECIGGAFGIETRFPFLDAQLVSTFLRLPATVKNTRYKSVIAKLLEDSDYPVERGVKRGFDPVYPQREVSLQRKVMNKVVNIATRFWPY